MKFNFRLPKFTELSREQKRAIEEINPILVTGSPGAGKTVVSIYRLKTSLDLKNETLLFIYNRMLGVAIKNAVQHLGLKDSSVQTIHRFFINETGKWLTNYDKDATKLHELLQNLSYNEFIFDEGQDLHIPIYDAFSKIGKVSIGADEAQQLYDVSTTEAKILNILPDLEEYHLSENYRNSFEIFNFAKEFVPNNARANDKIMLERLKKNSSLKPQIYVSDTFNDTKELIKKVLDANKGSNIAILVPSKHLVNEYYKVIKDDYECSQYHSGLSEEEKNETENNLQNILVTTFKSAKGMEFQTVMMLGFEQTNPDHSNQYFVGATRAKIRLFVFCIGKLAPIFENFNPATYELKKG